MKKPPFKKNKNQGGDGKPEKPFQKKKPFKSHSNADDKKEDRPFHKRKNDDFKSSEKKPFDKKKPYGKSYGEDRDKGKTYGEKKSYGKSKFGDDKSGEKSFGDKPFNKRGKGDFKSSDKPFDRKKPFGKSYGDESSSDKPFKRGDKKDFKSSDKPFDRKKPFGKSYGDGGSYDKPFKREERNDFKSSDKPFDKKKPFRSEEGGYGKPFKKGDRKDFKSSEKPFDKKRPFRKQESEDGGFDKFKKRKESVARPPHYNEDKFKKMEEKFGEKPEQPSEMRLNRYIAQSGLCSRREADELITKGLIKVNGKVVTEMGHKVKISDKVFYQGKPLQREKKVYVLLNKPKGFITTTSDPEERKTVMELVKQAGEERIYPVGRLDRETTGLLVLTNDGDLAKKLAHPSGEVQKIYHLSLDKPFAPEDEQKLVTLDFELEDGKVDIDGFNLLTDDRKSMGIELHSGRNRIVRRIFAHFGYQVEKLDRTVYAGLTKKDLPRGKWRFLTEKEVIQLKYFVGKRTAGKKKPVQ